MDGSFVARGNQGGTDVWKLWDNARLDELLEDMSKMEFMLRFTISNLDLDTTIVGTLSPEHLMDNVRAASQGPLSTDTYAEARKRLRNAATG